MSTPTTKPMFLVPRTLTWDKLCALYLMTRCLFPTIRSWSFKKLHEQGLFDVHFDGDPNEPSGVFDVDVQVDYKRSGHGSATAKVTENNSLDLPGLPRLIEMLGLNNQTGYLKSYEESLVGLIREVFNVGAEEPSRERRLLSIDVFWPAIEAYFAAYEEDEVAASAVAKGNPFTLPSLCKLLDIVRMSVQDSTEIMGKLQSVFNNASALLKVAVRRAEEIQATTFEVPAIGGRATVPGHWIDSDNTRIAKEYLAGHPEIGVLVVRRKSGNVAIFCRGVQSFDRLYEELERLEPGRWYLETRNPSPMLLNGSTSRHAVPTSLQKNDIISLIWCCYMHKSRAHQQR